MNTITGADWQRALIEARIRIPQKRAKLLRQIRERIKSPEDTSANNRTKPYEQKKASDT